jgi:hypothetical protein
VLVLFLGLLSLVQPPHVLSQAEAASTRKVLSRVVPQYPELARSMRIEGTVKVLVTVALTAAVQWLGSLAAILCWRKQP